MSNHLVKLPPFDSIVGAELPFGGFGNVLPRSVELESQILGMADAALERLRNGFQQRLELSEEIPKELDRIVFSMWNTGWDPLVGNVNLYVRDFGLALMQSIRKTSGGVLVYRSTEDLTHLSLYWRDRKLEAFPFHKIIKCLFNQLGESMAGFAEGIAGK